MEDIKVADRLEFLANTFDVFDATEKEEAILRTKNYQQEGYHVKLVLPRDRDESVDGKYQPDALALLAKKTIIKDNKPLETAQVSVSVGVFTAIVEADPTVNKSCAQWMLNTFTRLLKGTKDEYDQAIRFVKEDLPQARAYITLFEANKRKNKFKEFSEVSFSLKGMKDPTDINQYRSLAQLFDAVDPFIERKSSEVESLLLKYVDMGQAEMPVRDRKFTLFIPKSVGASVVFNKYANWCTAVPGNGMFSSYTTSNKKPDGNNSNLYIIIDNKFFTGESEEIYQIHFETNQIKDRKNGDNVSIFENVLSNSIGLSNYFQEELMKMAKLVGGKGIENNKYITYLIKFGFCESLFEFLEVNTPSIKFMSMEIPRMPDVSKFNGLQQFIITDAKLGELHTSIGKLFNLEMLILTNNNIKALPKEIGQLKKVKFINLKGNKIKEFPDEIKYLDKSNGGNLFRISVDEEEIGKANYLKLKKLLPTTSF